MSGISQYFSHKSTESKDSLVMVPDTLGKCLWDNSINVPEVPGNCYTFSSPLLSPINCEENVILPCWQEKGWAALQSETIPTKAEVHFFCAGEMCHLFLEWWSQHASRSLGFLLLLIARSFDCAMCCQFCLCSRK